MKPHFHRVGMHRREVLQVGFLGAVGATLPFAFPAAVHAARRRAKTDAVILVWLPGGPPQMQLWDLKPDLPAQCRGTAAPIKTSAPGVVLGSRLPLTAKVAHHLALVRTMTLGKEDENHIPGHQLLLGGIDERPATFKNFATRNDWPSIGSVVSALRPAQGGLPSAVHMPYRMRFEGAPIAGETAGWLGSRHDPWIIERDPNDPKFQVPDLVPVAGMTVDRLEQRRRLLESVDAARRDLDRDLEVRQLSDAQRKAFGLATSSKVRDAFDLGKEPAAMRERYGRHTFGQTLLLARRLVQAGVPFIQANLGDNVNFWDYHQSEDRNMDNHCPPFDKAFSALIEDLHDRRMLERTLVVVMSEMGRNPVLGKAVTGAADNAATSDGRNHWQWVWTGVFAGGGVRGGQTIGETDEWAGFPNSKEYYPSDMAATMFQCLGIDPHSEVVDMQERPIGISRGHVIEDLFR
ncbi:MAG: DUF1501 domain-containing protein [Armatimonadota bacterium]